MTASSHQPGDEPTKPKRKIDARRVLIALGWEKRPEDSKTPNGRNEDLLTRLGVKGGSLGAVVWILMKGVAAIDRQSEALEAVAKSSAAQVKQAEESTKALKDLGTSNGLSIREQQLTTREVSVVGDKVDKLADAIGVRRGREEPIPSRDVKVSPVGRGK